MRLIDADALMALINNSVFTADMTTTLAVNMAARWIENAPTIEPGQKKGRWYRAYHIWFCDQCGNPTKGMGYVQGTDELFNFCPNCGADMRGEK